MTPREISLAGLFVGLSWSLGWALAPIPNVELVSATVFAAGLMLGAPLGSLVGVVGMAFFSLLNPFGPVPFPVLAAQVVGMGLFGAAGGWCRTWAWAWADPSRSTLLVGAVGLGLTFVYDLLTNLASAVAFGFSGKLSVYLVGGLAFSVLHVLANVTIFSVVGAGVFPALLRRSKRDS